MESVEQFLNDLLTSGADGFTVFQVLAAVGIAYLGGVIASLTPCVYPMIPITIGVIGGLGESHHHTSRKSEWRSVALRAAAYIAGLVVIYAVLGVVAGLTGAVFGTLTNSHGWYLGLGIIMTLAALMMVDVIPFDPAMLIERIKRGLPGGAKPRPAHKTEKEVNVFGAFALGATSGFVASPCTTPILTVVLAYIARTQSVGMGFVLMTGFALGLGTLLLIVALFAGALQAMPRSGRWMHLIKKGSGIILLGFAQYLFYRAGNLGGN